MSSHLFMDCLEVAAILNLTYATFLKVRASINTFLEVIPNVRIVRELESKRERYLIKTLIFYTVDQPHHHF